MKEILFVFLAIILGVVLFVYGVFYIGWVQNYSMGERTGEIYKFSKKGLIWKSWEGEMYLGGVSKNSEGGLVLDKFYFSIPEFQESEKTDIIQKVKECSEKRSLCTIEYIQWLKKPGWQDSSYTIEKVK